MVTWRRSTPSSADWQLRKSSRWTGRLLWCTAAARIAQADLRPSSPQACSRKLTPLRQWFYFDALECLPEEEDEEVTLPEADVAAVRGEDTITYRRPRKLVTINIRVFVSTLTEKHQVRWTDRRVWIRIPREAQEAEIFPGW